MNLRWKIAQFFEAWWWSRYLRGKSLDDYLEWKKQYWQRFLHAAGVSASPHYNILDVGCGPAGIFIQFDRHPDVTAMDPLMSKYRALWPGVHDRLFPNVRFIETAFEKYSAEAPFSLVFCLNAINHVADLDACLYKLREVTHPQGQLVLSVDAHNFLFFKKLFQLIPGDILHPHQLDLKDYKKKLEQSGFSILNEKPLKRDFFFTYYLLVLST
jgi:2-polyprenyl-6-hydroxyphenyl methylase/3-demethylubiquinone-9 3-methyltransferase